MRMPDSADRYAAVWLRLEDRSVSGDKVGSFVDRVVAKTLRIRGDLSCIRVSWIADVGAPVLPQAKISAPVVRVDSVTGSDTESVLTAAEHYAQNPQLARVGQRVQNGLVHL